MRRVSITQAIAVTLSTDGNHDASYAMMAARRSERRRILAFVKLLDFMLADSWHAMVVSSVSHALHLLQAARHIPIGSQVRFDLNGSPRHDIITSAVDVCKIGVFASAAVNM